MSTITVTKEDQEVVLSAEEIAAAAEARQRAIDSGRSAVAKAFEKLASAYGNEHDALHDVVYAFDVTTRMRALNRIVQEGSGDAGTALTLHIRNGGYEFTITKPEGKSEVSITAPDIDVYDRNGVKFDVDGYKNLGAENWTAAKSKVAPAVGRIGMRVADAANSIYRPPEVKDRAPRKSSGGSKVADEVASLRAQVAEQNKQSAEIAAMLAQLLQAQQSS